MENKINYKEENENLRLKLELSKQREREMLLEKELLELRMRCNRECNKNENPFKEVVDNKVSKTEDKNIKTEDNKVVKTKDKKMKTKKSKSEDKKVVKTKDKKIKTKDKKVSKTKDNKVSKTEDKTEDIIKVKINDDYDFSDDDDKDKNYKFIEAKKYNKIIEDIKNKKINTTHEKALINECNKKNKNPTINEIETMLENKAIDKNLQKEAEDEEIVIIDALKKNILSSKTDEKDDYMNSRKYDEDIVNTDITIQGQNTSLKARRYLSMNNRFILRERKEEIINKLPKYDVIYEDEDNKKLEIFLIEKTPKQYIKKYEVKVISNIVENQLIKNSKIIYDTLLKDLKLHNGLKVNIVLKLKVSYDTESHKKYIEPISIMDKMIKSKEIIDNNERLRRGEKIVEKAKKEDKIQNDFIYVSTMARIIMNKDELLYFSTGEDMWDKYINIGEKSGLTIDGVYNHYINVYKYAPLKGGSYIELPLKYKNSSKGLLNIVNKNDNKCFMWCHLAYLYPATNHHKNRVSNYKVYEDKVNYNNINFPITLEQIPKIEKQNMINFNIFTFSENNNYIIPLCLTKSNYEKSCNLLLLSENKNEDNNINTHYVLITDISKLLYNQNNKGKRLEYCLRCLQYFYTKEKLALHLKLCNKVDVQKTVFPTKKNKNLSFKNYKHKIPVPFVVYADFEAFNKVCEKQETENQTTEKIADQEICSYAYKLVCCLDDKFSKPLKLYRGHNAAAKFIRDMLDENEYCNKIFNEHFTKKIIQLTEKQEEEFKNSKYCHICNKKYTKDYNTKVRDHDHFTGNYMGSAHTECNKGFKYNRRLTVFFHNLKGYDSHFLIQKIGAFNKEVKVIPINTEKFISFSIGFVDFKDSFQFMSVSLSSLVENLVKKEKAENNKDVFKYLATEFEGEQLELLKQKGVFPYEYLNSFDRFNDTKLPDKENFYSRLSNRNITDNDYNHAINVWNTFKMKNFGDYHDIYLKSDVLLLADVFENFRKLCLNYYKLDPVHYFGTPGIAWDACLKMSEQTLELITDPDIYLFVENAKRGGMSFIGHRYAKANNKYMKNFDTNKEASYLMYFDANSLYSKAMCYPLPVGNYKWFEGHKKEFILKCFNENKYNFMVECDIEYPEELHDIHNDYPLAPEKLVVDDNFKDLKYCHEIRAKFEKDYNYKLTKSKVPKLISSLTTKKNYIVHARLLKYYLELGLKIKPIKILTFNEKPWMKTFIEFNIDKRINAKNAFEIDFFKLMNNSVYGKTMENVRKRCNLIVKNNEESTLRYIAKPTFKDIIKISNSFFIINRFKDKVNLNKPMYVGVAVLDYSKLIMYRYHYSLFKNFYGNNARLLMTDTDSLFYEIKTEDVYKDLFDNEGSKLKPNKLFKDTFGELTEISDLFDRANLKKDNIYYSNENNKVSGLLKIENADNIIKEFVALKSKNYAFKYAEEYEEYLNDGDKAKLLRCKGVVRATVEDNIKVESMIDTIKNSTLTRHDNYCLRSKKHKIGLYKINKISLSCYDDKRYILEDGITSYAHGHYKIKTL